MESQNFETVRQQAKGELLPGQDVYEKRDNTKKKLESLIGEFDKIAKKNAQEKVELPAPAPERIEVLEKHVPFPVKEEELIVPGSPPPEMP